MDITNEENKREEFRNILLFLAKSQKCLKTSKNKVQMYKRLEALYWSSDPDNEPRFRHYYSDIFSVLTQIKLDNENGSIDVLGQNLKIIREGYMAQNNDCNGNLIDISDSIRKLYDHVNLDIARMIYSNFTDREITGKETISEIQESINNTRNDMDDVRNDLWDVRNKLEDSTSKSVSILGIFAGIFTAFMAGLSILTGAFSALDSEISKYRMFSLFLIIGLVLYNVIVVLLFVISRISGRDNIGIVCKYSWSCNDCKHLKTKNRALSKIICQAYNKYPYIILGDAILIYLLYGVIVFWLFSENNTDIFSGLISLLPDYAKDIVTIIMLVLPFLVLSVVHKLIFNNEEKMEDGCLYCDEEEDCCEDLSFEELDGCDEEPKG